MSRLSKWLWVEGWWVSLLTVTIAIGLFARIQDLGQPPTLTSDEYHFVENARNLMAGVADTNDHPPLGKWLIACGIIAFGDTAVGWRAAPLVFGLMTLGLCGVLCLRVTGRWQAGLLAAALVALDGFFIAYSRTALLDGILTCCMLAALVLLLDGRRNVSVYGAAVVIGVAACIKWTAFVLTLALLLTMWRKRCSSATIASALLVVALTYGATSSGALALGRQKAAPAAVFAEQLRLFREHTKPLRPHVLSSGPSSWLILEKPILLRRQRVGEHWKILSTMGNPLAWWLSTACVLGVTTVQLVPRFGRILRRRLGPVGEDTPSPDFRLLMVAWAAPVIPWCFGVRQSFIYHYLPSYAVALCVLAIVMDAIGVRWKPFRLALPTLVIAVGLLYLPFCIEYPVTADYFERCLPFPAWRGLRG